MKERMNIDNEVNAENDILLPLCQQPYKL